MARKASPMQCVPVAHAVTTLVHFPFAPVAIETFPEQGDVFPDDIDADQDGVVYYLLPADWDGNYDMEPVDGAKYRTWRESFLEGASEMDDIWFWDLKEENIAILGAEKPN